MHQRLRTITRYYDVVHSIDPDWVLTTTSATENVLSRQQSLCNKSRDLKSDPGRNPYMRKLDLFPWLDHIII